MTPDRSAEVLVVDRDATLGRRVMAFLAERDHTVEWVNDGEKAFNRLDSHLFDVLVTELDVGRVNGMRLMTVAKERNPDVCVVLIAEPSDIELATEAMRQGAYDYQTRPLNLGKLEAVIQRGLDHQRLVLAQHELRRRLDDRYGLRNLVGQSRQMIKVYDAVRQVAPTSAAVLIQGEPGTGKDLIAQAIHNNSPRRDEPFVKFDCASMPPRLQEIELFGHAADPTSSTPHPWRGGIEVADGGSLFLDEVWALPGPIQTALLEVLQAGQYGRPGDGQRVTSDVRMLVATPRPLRDMVETGAFSDPLYQALSAVTIEVPALRDRREDIPLLVEHVAHAACREAGKSFAGISRNGLDLLMRYEWPGNVRELRNVVEGMVALARQGRALHADDVPAHIRRDTASEADEIRIPTGVSMSQVERVAIEQTLKTCGYNKESCAKTLGIGLRTLYRKLREYDIR